MFSDILKRTLFKYLMLSAKSVEACVLDACVLDPRFCANNF